MRVERAWQGKRREAAQMQEVSRGENGDKFATSSVKGEVKARADHGQTDRTAVSGRIARTQVCSVYTVL
jgi:hypothetical protein